MPVVFSNKLVVISSMAFVFEEWIFKTVT